MIGVILLFVAILLLLYTFYKWATQNNDFFERRNMKYLKPGIIPDVFSTKYTAAEYAKRLNNAFPNEPIFGTFFFREPQYIVCDPEIVEQIAVKAFDHFEDHRGFGEGANCDPLWGKPLFFMRGEKWRQMRATLSPAFTGSKMRHMFELVVKSAVDTANHFLERSKTEPKISIETKDFFSRYTNDVIATCAFGIKVNSFAEPDNEFYTNGRKLMDFTSIKRIVNAMMITLLPKIAKALNITFSDQSASNIFRSTILDTMRHRQEKNIYRPDMINILMQIREGTLHHQTDEKKEENEGFATVEESDVGMVTVKRTWDDDDIVAQCFGFFIGGFDTTSNLLTFLAYELTVHPDIQQRLYEEIAQTNDQLGQNGLTYDAMQKMKYLDQVICEALRRWPSFAQLDRQCVKEFVFEFDDSPSVKVEKGRNIQFNLYGIHHNPKYFPEPEKFDPDRFNYVNKANIVPGSYLPFGIGPRNCVGSRFALMEIKAILYYLLLNFSFEPNEKTQIPLKLKKTASFLIPESKIHVDLIPRHNNILI